MQTNLGRRMFTREQKMGAILLFVFALLAVGLGFLQLRNNIYGPFVIRPLAERAVAELFTDETARLQRIDTDHDGLNDYEELEFYHTSPYLPDTDSDGTGDKEELDHDEDPLCPAGTACEGAEGGAVAEGQLVVPPIGEDETALDLLGQTAANAQATYTGEVTDLNSLANNPALLRKLLLDSGKISKTDLDRIDDATLLSIAQNLLNQTVTTTQ